MRTWVESASDSHVEEMRPESATTGFCQSSSKFCVKVAATLGDAIVKITFSSRVHESLVQLADPVRTAADGVPASRTTYLWCMRSGTPGIGLISTPKDFSWSTNAQSISAGGGTARPAGWSWLNMRRTCTPRLMAA